MGGPSRSSARSTISMARSTPAQKPRGLERRICMVWIRTPCPILADLAAVGAPLTQHVQDQETGADDDGAVGDVEGRPMAQAAAADVEVYEIDDVAARRAVDHVPERAAQDEG